MYEHIKYILLCIYYIAFSAIEDVNCDISILTKYLRHQLQLKLKYNCQVKMGSLIQEVFKSNHQVQEYSSR
jgi:hypothetical protein